jgi:hypothetical protein
VQKLLAVLSVVVELALVRGRVRRAQARDGVGLVQRQADREERVVVGDGISLVMEAHRHAHADRAEIAVAQAYPASHRTRHDRQDRVVDRGAVQRLGRLVQGRQRHRGEGNLAAAADPPVER